MPNRFYDVDGDLSTQLAPWAVDNLSADLLAETRATASTALFRLEQELRFRSDIAGGDIVVPVGFVSDLASIPQLAWSIFLAPDDPRVELAGWIHDWIYSSGGRGVTFGIRALSRKEADRILAFEAMAELGASRWQRYAVYYAVRLFGSRCWRLPR